MISVISDKFDVNSEKTIEIPRTKAGQKLVIEKIHIDKIDNAGNIIDPDNLIITLMINKWPVLDKYSGSLLSAKPNTTTFNHQFDRNDDIRLEVKERVPSGADNSIILTLSIKYLDPDKKGEKVKILERQIQEIKLEKQLYLEMKELKNAKKN